MRVRPLFAALGLAVLPLLASCGSGRSVEAYCQTFYGVGGEMRQQWQQAADSGDLGKSLEMIFTGPGELASFYGRLEKVSPDAIEPDVKTLHDNAQKLADSLGANAGNPLKGVLRSLELAASNHAAEDHVNAYTLKHCGPPPH